MKKLLNHVRWPKTRERAESTTLASAGRLADGRVRHQAALAYLSRKALRAAPSTSLLGDVCRIAARVLSADHVHVLELLPNRRTLIARAAAGMPPERLAQWQMDLSPRSRLRDLLRTGGLMLVDDATDVDCPPGAADLLHELRMRDGLAIGISPLGGTSALFGVYSAVPRRFSREDVQFVRAVAPIVESAVRREAEMNLDRLARANDSAAHADLLRVVVDRLRPALQQSVEHMWSFRRNPTDSFTFRRVLKMSEKQVASVADFIEDLSLYADLLDGRLPPRRVVLVGPVLESLVDQLSDRAHTREIRLNLDVVDEFAATTGDPMLLRRALFNLLDNAIRFTPPGGRVDMCVAPQDSSTIVIHMVDSGRGMTAEQVDALAGIRGPADLAQGGSGLGWRLATAIVQAHGGTITANSPGRDLGTRITVRLPRLVFEDFSLPGPTE